MAHSERTRRARRRVALGLPLGGGPGGARAPPCEGCERCEELLADLRTAAAALSRHAVPVRLPARSCGPGSSPLGLPRRRRRPGRPAAAVGAPWPRLPPLSRPRRRRPRRRPPAPPARGPREPDARQLAGRLRSAERELADGSSARACSRATTSGCWSSAARRRSPRRAPGCSGASGPAAACSCVEPRAAAVGQASTSSGCSLKGKPVARASSTRTRRAGPSSSLRISPARRRELRGHDRAARRRARRRRADRARRLAVGVRDAGDAGLASPGSRCGPELGFAGFLLPHNRRVA